MHAWTGSLNKWESKQVWAAAESSVLKLQYTHKIIQLLERHNCNNLHFYLEGCRKQLCKNSGLSAVKVLSSFPSFSHVY